MEPLMTTAALVIVAAFALAGAHPQQASTVSVEEVHAAMSAGKTLTVLDVRTPQEFYGATGHLEGAMLIPLQDLSMRLNELKSSQRDTIIVYCRTDNRSGMAVSILNENGFTAVRMKGGITAWGQASLPVVHEEAP